MTEQSNGFDVELEREQELAIRLQMAEYAIVVEAVTLAKVYNLPGLDSLRELISTRDQLMAEHLEQMRRTTVAIRTSSTSEITSTLENSDAH